MIVCVQSDETMLKTSNSEYQVHLLSKILSKFTLSLYKSTKLLCIVAGIHHIKTG